MKRKYVRLEMRQFTQLLVLSCLFVVVLLSFQNCGAPMEESDELASVASNAPFPLTAKMDRIAHMSCVGNTTAYPNHYFSYKFLADGAGSGFSMRPEFVSHTGGYTAQKRSEVFRENPLSAGAQFQLVLRSSDYNSAYAANIYPAEISSAPIADPMSALVKGEYKNDFNPELALTLVLNNDLSEDSRKKLTAGDVFTVNFAPNGSVKPIFPSINQYELSFTRPTNISSGASTQLAGVQELRLESNEQRNWNCDPKLRFMIVREMDRGVQTICTPPASDPAFSSLSAENQYKLRELRKFLSPADWGVDLSKNCIVAKVPANQDLCYGNAVNKTIRYDQASSCDVTLNSCPHYFSICTR